MAVKLLHCNIKFSSGCIKDLTNVRKANMQLYANIFVHIMRIHCRLCTYIRMFLVHAHGKLYAHTTENESKASECPGAVGSDTRPNYLFGDAQCPETKHSGLWFSGSIKGVYIRMFV